MLRTFCAFAAIAGGIGWAVYNQFSQPSNSKYTSQSSEASSAAEVRQAIPVPGSTPSSTVTAIDSSMSASTTPRSTEVRRALPVITSESSTRIPEEHSNDPSSKSAGNNGTWFTVLSAYNDTPAGRISSRQDQTTFTRLLSSNGDNYDVAIYKADNGKLAVTMGVPQTQAEATDLANIAKQRRLSPTAYPRNGKHWIKIP